jgi:hypothetical protein
MPIFHRSPFRNSSLLDAKVVTWIVLAVLLSAAYLPVLAGRMVFGRDLVRFLHPMYWFVVDSLRRGDTPWWIPHIGLGHSLLADPQSGVFYPVNLLHHLGPLPRMMMVVFMLHLAWGAVGMVKLARAFDLSPAPASVAGLSWTLSGYMASLWTNGARLPSACWMPWQALAFVALARALQEGRGFGAIAWLALANGLAILAGDPFVAVMGMMLGFALATVWLADAWRSSTRPLSIVPRTHGLRFLVGSVGASVLGALVAGASLVPAASALGGTERSGGVSLDVAQAGSLHPLRLLEFASPESFARAWYEAPAEPWVASYLDGSPLSFSVYLGGAVLVLLVLAFLPAARRPPSRRTATLVAAVATFFLLLALGRHTPVFSLVRVLLPPVSYMRAPEKFLLAFVPCAALLAGWGAQRLLEHRPRWGWSMGALALLALPLLVARLLPMGLAGMVQKQALHACLAGAVILSCWALAPRLPRLAGVLLAVVVTADLATATGMTLRWDGLGALGRPAAAMAIQPNTSTPATPFPRLFRGSKVQLVAGRSAALDGDALTRETLRDNLSVPLGIAILPGYGVAIPPVLGDILALGRLDALRLLAVDYALLSVKDDDAPVPKGLLLRSIPLPGVRLYEIEHRLPRVFVALHAQKLDATELGRHLLDPDVVAGKTVLLDARESWAPTDSSPEAALPCALLSFTNHSLEAICDSPRPGLVVFVEQYAPGWRATVDGTSAPILKSNLIMRGVPMPAGRHTVVLTYAAPGLAAGVLSSALGMGAVLGLALAAKRRRKRP